METRCVAGCYWKVYGSWLQERVSFVIKSVHPMHKCGRSLKNEQTNCDAPNPRGPLTTRQPAE